MELCVGTLSGRIVIYFDCQDNPFSLKYRFYITVIDLVICCMDEDVGFLKKKLLTAGI